MTNCYVLSEGFVTIKIIIIVVITNFVAVSSVGITRVHCIGISASETDECVANLVHPARLPKSNPQRSCFSLALDYSNLKF